MQELQATSTKLKQLTEFYKRLQAFINLYCFTYIPGHIKHATAVNAKIIFPAGQYFAIFCPSPLLAFARFPSAKIEFSFLSHGPIMNQNFWHPAFYKKMSFSLEITDYQVTRRDVLNVKRLGRDMTASFGRLALISFSPCSPTGREMFLTEETVSFSSCVLYLPGCPFLFYACNASYQYTAGSRKIVGMKPTVQYPRTSQNPRTREPESPRVRESESSRARGSQKIVCQKQRAVTRAEYLIRYDNITIAISYVFLLFQTFGTKVFFLPHRL